MAFECTVKMYLRQLPEAKTSTHAPLKAPMTQQIWFATQLEQLLFGGRLRSTVHMRAVSTRGQGWYQETAMENVEFLHTSCAVFLGNKVSFGT